MILKKILKVLLVISCIPLILLWLIFFGSPEDIILLIKDFITKEHSLTRKDVEKMTK